MRYVDSLTISRWLHHPPCKTLVPNASSSRLHRPSGCNPVPVLAFHDHPVLSSKGRRHIFSTRRKISGSSFSSTMNLSSFELYVFLYSFALLALYAFYKHWTDPLAQIPTIHWSAPYSRSYIIWQIYQNRRRYAHYDAHMKRDGEILPLIRVGPNEISMMTTQGIKIVYDGGFERTLHYTVFRNFG